MNKFKRNFDFFHLDEMSEQKKLADVYDLKIARD